MVDTGNIFESSEERFRVFVVVVAGGFVLFLFFLFS